MWVVHTPHCSLNHAGLLAENSESRRADGWQIKGKTRVTNPYEGVRCFWHPGGVAWIQFVNCNLHYLTSFITLYHFVYNSNSNEKAVVVSLGSWVTLKFPMHGLQSAICHYKIPAVADGDNKRHRGSGLNVSGDPHGSHMEHNQNPNWKTNINQKPVESTGKSSGWEDARGNVSLQKEAH